MRKKQEGVSKNTKESYTNELRIFSNYMQKPAEKIVAADIRLYLGEFPDLKNSSISTKLSILKSFLSWLAGNEYIPKDPTVLIKPPKKEKRLPKGLTIGELETVREVCENTREKALVEVLYSTGCRISEVIALNKRDIDFNSGSTRVIGKGDKERTVYFNWKALHYLKKYFLERKDSSHALFVSTKRPYNRLGDRAIQHIIKDIAERSGLEKNIHPHVFRHTLATLMLNNGADIVAVQEILGHESASTTQTYAILTEQRKKESYQKYMVQ